MGDQSFTTGKIQDSTKGTEKPKLKRKKFGNYLYIKISSLVSKLIKNRKQTTTVAIQWL